LHVLINAHDGNREDVDAVAERLVRCHLHLGLHREGAVHGAETCGEGRQRRQRAIRACVVAQEQTVCEPARKAMQLWRTTVDQRERERLILWAERRGEVQEAGRNVLLLVRDQYLCDRCVNVHGPPGIAICDRVRQWRM
jgi:hypothetical protein